MNKFTTQVFTFYFLFVIASCCAQTNTVRFEKLCYFCPDFPDSTIIALKDNNNSVDTIKNFRIELTNYYNYWSHFDTNSQLYVFIGLVNFKNWGDGKMTNNYQVLTYMVKNDEMKKNGVWQFSSVDTVGYRLSFKFSKDKLLIFRGNEQCKNYSYTEFLQNNFIFFIPNPR